MAKGQGHNFWEGFFHCRELVDFAIDRRGPVLTVDRKVSGGFQPVSPRQTLTSGIPGAPWTASSIEP